MPKAPLIRADTIDLQDADAPSAKDHSRRPSSPGAIGEGPPAPHQAATLRHASADDSSLVGRSPRASQDLSGKELQLLHEIHSDIDEQDAAEIEASLGITRNGDQGVQGHHDGEVEDEDEEGMDDDMMDKISSSPSIDDGGYSPPRLHDVGRRPAAHCAVDFPFALLPHPPKHPCSEHLATLFVPEATADSQHHLFMPGRYPEEKDLEETSRDSEDVHSSSDSVHVDESDSEGGSESLETSADWLVFGGDQGDDISEGESEKELAEISKVVASTALESSYLDRSDSLDDAADDALVEEDFRRIDSGWGNECLQDPEDIDFEFVYALHTFVATVEGQANATKGDTMVLLDDSNSYWWLVRVVKDSSIGYLPAEHIETPTERLARLNKHRNIDLSQTMLGDNPEKSRNPLKKAMRRRNVKTVAFTDPIYYEPEIEDYSTDEENEDDPDFITTADAAHDQSNEQQQHQQDQQATNAEEEQDDAEPVRVEPLRIRTVGYDRQKDQAAGILSPTDPSPKTDRPRASEESVESPDGTTKSPRRMRNTDSFYKDENIETRKISLTPNILRDDSTSGGGTVMDARASLEGLEKPASIEKGKEDKKKEKKPSKFSGFFKRKNSKTKSHHDDETEDWLKGDRGDSPQPKQSSESTLVEQTPISPVKSQPGRPSSKLQKKSGSLRRSDSKEDHGAQKAVANDQAAAPKLDTAPGFDSNPFDDSAAVEAEQAERKQQDKGRSLESDGRVTSPTSEPLRNVFNPVRDAFRAPSAQAAQEPRLEKVKKAKNRMALDDSDSDDETPDPTASFPVAPTRQVPEPAKDRLSESPVQVSLANSQPAPALVADNSSPSTHTTSPASPSSSPELIERPSDMPAGKGGDASGGARIMEAMRTTTPPTTTGGASATAPHVNGDMASASNTPGSATGSTRSRATEWSDVMLRDYLDRCGDEFRDMLAIVHAPPPKPPAVNRDDPIWRRHEETMARCDEMQRKLDRVLLDFYKSRGVDF